MAPPPVDPWLDQICTYLGGVYDPAYHSYRSPTIPGVGVVRRGVPKVQDWAEYTEGLGEGTETGCMITVTMNTGDERRITVPARLGVKHISVTVVLHCFFYSMAAYGEDLQDQVHYVRRSILDQLALDNTLGSGGFEAGGFQVGEADERGAGGETTWGTSPPETDEDNTSQQYMWIQFEAHGHRTG